MKKIKRYSQAEAREIIKDDYALQQEYERLKPSYDTGTLDHSFEYGNFFNSDLLTSDLVAIQWYAEDNDNTVYEIIVDSLESAVVTLRDIMLANGNLREELNT